MFNNLPENLKKLLEDKNTIPSQDKVFRAFTYFQPQNTKVIIIGQDPYPNREHASGLAFSTENGYIPPSLRNIFKELSRDIGCEVPKSGNLEKWAHQGVLLLNTVLTTRSGVSKAHTNKGWQEFTGRKIQKILDLQLPVVIIAWGKDAQNFVSTLSLHSNTIVLTGGHPSPLNRARNFLGGKYFSRANDFLKSKGVREINWTL